jgi:dihydrolipoamide dehydrogenase
MAEYDYDVLVIGAGPGGYVAAIKAAQLGLRTACVDDRDAPGGTCLNIGCIPSKAMLHASELFDAAANGTMSKLGVEVTPRLNLDAMHAQRRDAVKQLTGGVEFLFRKNKVTWIKGHGTFEDTHTVVVNGERITAKDIVIATGSNVTPLPGVRLDQKVVLDSEGALQLPAVPKDMVVIGGGVIGVELGSVWRRLGANVTVIEYLDQILPGFDEDVRAEAHKFLAKQGITFRLGNKVTRVEVSGARATLTVKPTKGGEAEQLEADCVLVAIGRCANTVKLGLENAGLEINERGQVEIDDKFRTAVPDIWAIGDVVRGPMLAHKAEDEGVAVALNIAGQVGVVNNDAIPTVVYTYPEIAGVGLTEAAARERGEVKVGKFPMLANSRAKTIHEPIGFVKVIADAVSDRVVGVWIVATVAGTMIAEAVLGMELGATSEDIANTCHAHPTHNEAVKEAAMAVTGKPINF